MTSTVYDMGKELGRACPHPPDLNHPLTKSYFEEGFRDILQLFPSLLGNVDLMRKSCIDHGKHKISLKTHLKVNAKNGFRRGVSNR